MCDDCIFSNCMCESDYRERIHELKEECRNLESDMLFLLQFVDSTKVASLTGEEADRFDYIVAYLVEND